MGLRAWLAQHWHSRAVRRWLIAVVIVGTVLPVSQARANVDLVDVEDEVMCVVCERPLSTSAGSAAEDQRAVIQRMIDDGLSKDEIKDELVAEYGERVLVDDGNPVAAAAPVIVAVIGAGSIALLLRRRRREAPAGTSARSEPEATDLGATPDDTSTPQVSAADDARIDAELAERE
ncbi:MAG: cytochrome c-type biogenesis protein CcmH [Solirubrobacteraceae bacterium]|nr:cytochrome c-type biogenesis protein CcmH [Solirubrobacteraceae bacterium]